MGGKLIIAGGNLEFCDKQIHKILVEHARSKGGKLAIVPTASGKEPFKSIAYVEELWKDLGVDSENIITLPVYGEEGSTWMEPAPGDNPEIINMLEGLAGFWFTGGDQYYTYKAFIRKDNEDTKALQIMKQIYRDGGVIGGTSAGAAIMSKTMIARGNNTTALSKPIKYGYDDYNDSDDDEETIPLRIVRGLGFFPDGVIDQHFDKRPRLLRLMRTVMESESFFGYGVSEDTALIYDSQTRDISVAGSGAVYILDLRKSKDKECLSAYRDAVLHVIKEGDSFNQWKIL